MEPAENFYELLEVESTASFEEVQQAYEKKLEEVHEESLASYSLCPVDENEELLKKLSEAFMQLANPEVRRSHDLKLGAKPKETPEQDILPSAKVAEVNQEHGDASREGKVVFLRPQLKTGGFSTSTGEAFQTIVGDIQKPNPITKLSRPNVGASLEEITLQSAKVRQDAFQKLAEKNRMTDAKLQEYYQFLEANEGVIRYSGSVLHQIRELKGITIMELATVTCVRGTYLESIEKENFETFPSSVYLKGYLNCYLKALELPLEEVSEQYMTLFDEWNEGGTRKNSI